MARVLCSILHRRRKNFEFTHVTYRLDDLTQCTEVIYKKPHLPFNVLGQYINKEASLHADYAMHIRVRKTGTLKDILTVFQNILNLVIGRILYLTCKYYDCKLISNSFN